MGGMNRGTGLADTITGTQAKVRSILPDRVILNNQGQDETLMLDGEEFKAVGASTPTTPAAAPGAPLTQLRDDPGEKSG